MRNFSILFVAYLLLVCQLGNASELITGEIFTNGGPSNRRVTVLEGTSQSIQLCGGDISYVIGQLAGCVLTMQGSLVKENQGEKKCLAVETFEILEISKGRPAIVGVLTDLGSQTFAIVDKSGKKWNLGRASSGVADLRSENVVADLVASETTSAGATWLVARIFSMPKP